MYGAISVRIEPEKSTLVIPEIANYYYPVYERILPKFIETIVPEISIETP